MSKMNTVFQLTALSAALLAVHTTCRAADDTDLKQYTDPVSSISAGIGYLGGDRPQLGKYDGLYDHGAKLLLDADVYLRDDASGTWDSLVVRNLGLDSREAKLGHEQQGNWGVSLEYNQIPSKNPKTYITGVTGIGTNSLTYGGIGTSGANAQAKLYPATTEVHLGTERDITKLNFKKYLMRGLDVQVSFRNEQKDGTRAWGRGSNPEFAVEPIDWTTQQLDAIVNYAVDRLQLSGGYSGSWFENHNSYDDTIGCSQTGSTGGHTILSLPLDNEAWQLFLNGGYMFTPTTRGTFKVAYTHATQNDSLDAITNALRSVPGASGSNLPDASGVPSSLNGEVNTTLYQLGLTSRPMPRLHVTANFRYQNRDDNTPDVPIGNAATAATTASPWSFKNTAGKLEATYQLDGGYTVTPGWDYDRRERGLPFDDTGAYDATVKLRARTTENTWRIRLGRNLSETLTGNLAYLHSKRDGSTWYDADAEVLSGLTPPDQTPTTVNWLNPFAYADRTRNKVRLFLDWEPVESASLQFNYEWSKDKYGADPHVGLQDGSAQLVSLDGELAVNQDWHLTAWLSHDETKANQMGLTYDPRTTSLSTSPTGWYCTSANATGCSTDLNWNANLKDTGNTIGVGLRGNATPKLKVGGDIQWTRTKSQYPISSNVPSYVNSSNKSQQGLPDITDTMTRIKLFAQYALRKNADVRLDVIHERWSSNDWSWMTWDSTGTTLIPFQYMDGTKVVADQKQNSTFVSVRYSYKF